MKHYKAYKDSGIEWLGKIPEHWDLMKVFYLFKAKKGANATILTKEYCSENKGSFPVYSGQTENNGVMGCINNFEFEFPNGVVLSTTVGANAMSANYLQGKFSLSQNCMIIINRDNQIISKFSYYYFQRLFAYERSKIPSHMQPSFRMEDLYGYKICFPNILEQTQIANFLDQKTTQIDELITKKELLIQLLEEERKAIINQAVTKGLNPDAPMKDSGIDWLGEIPEHWKNNRIDWIAKLIRGNTGLKKDELLNEGEYVALQYGKTYKINEVNDTFNYYVNSEYFKENQIVNFGDTIFISTSETIEDLGHSCYYNRNDLGLIGGEQILLKPDSRFIFNKYLYYYSKKMGSILQKYAKGLKVFRFKIDDLKQVSIPLPPIQEQVKIVKHLDSEMMRIRSLKKLYKKEIELLKEYKTTLISDVVTGKIDVREEVLN